MSKPSGLPLGAELADFIAAFAKEAGVPVHEVPLAARSNPLEVSQRVIDARPDLRESLHEAVASHLLKLEKATEPSAALRALAQTTNAVSLVITLNYDRLLERAASDIGRPSREIGVDEIPSLVNDGLRSTGGPKDELRVVHIHGSLRDDPETLVLDAASYAKRAGDDRVRRLFGAILPYYSVCILGSSFEEQYLATMLQAFRPTEPAHIVVCRESLGDRIRSGAATLSETRHNVIVCSYPDDEDDVLEPFCVEPMRPEDDRPPPGQARIAVEDADIPDLYTPRTLSIASLTGEEPEHVDEQELHQLSRTLVLGGPGTGKTLLLKQLAQDPPPGERAVFIRLRDVGEGVGTPAALLKDWLGIAATFDLTEPVDAASVVSGSTRVHLLLDGLDELPNSIRSGVAEAIVRVGQAMPQLRITVSGRPTTALDVFPAHWQRADLLCDASWRAALLQRAGTDDRRLAERLGDAHAAISPLLDVPFFLQRTLDLLAEGKRPIDGLDLTLRLLDETIARDPALHKIAPDVRRWLERVALSMVLSGAAAMSVDDAVELASDLDLGDAKRAAGLLTERSLLLQTAGRYAFQHRLLGEALVADYLVLRDPDDWLGVLAPKAQGLSAVLEDWRGVATLLLPRSSRWRAVIGARDMRAVSRTTPQSADVEDRRAAATFLWEDARRKDVWIDRERGPGIGPDERVVGAHIRAGGLDELAARVRDDAASGTSRFHRGNAVKIIAAAALADSEAILRRVLVVDDDPVVRRIASHAALDLQLSGLVDVLVRRASSPDDRLEGQALSTAALGLAPVRERTALALSILNAASTHAEVGDWHVTDGMPAADQVIWFAARLRAEPREYWYAARQLPEIVGSLRRASARLSSLVAYVAAVARCDDARVVAFVEKRDACAVGLIDAFDEDAIEPFEMQALLLAVGLDALRRHGASQRLRDQVAWWTDPPSQGVRPPQTRPRRRVQRVEDPLGKWINAPDTGTRLWLVHEREAQFREPIRDADARTRRAVRVWLDELWAGQDLRRAVRVDGNSAQISNWAGAVLLLGPEVEMSVDGTRWAQVVLCEWLWPPQHRWLEEQVQPGFVDQALSLTPSPRSIADLARFVSAAEIAAVARAACAMEALDERAANDLVYRLMALDRADLIREVAARQPAVAEIAGRSLAQLGDPSAQRAELRHLVETLAADGGTDRHTAPWLDAVADARLFSLLSEAYSLAARKRRPDVSPFDDLTAPLQEAMERADPRRAVAFYDDLIATQPWTGAQWVLERRDDTVQRLLTGPGRVAARAAAASLGLPWLTA
jgi:CheY-like chemotaxis protein